MAINYGNLLQGAARLYVANFGAVEPTDAAIGTEPSSAVWTEVGATNGGISMNLGEEYGALEADQAAFRAGSARVMANAEVTVNLAEITIQNLAVALNTRNTNLITGANFKKFVPATGDVDEFSPNYKAALLWGTAPNSPTGQPQKFMLIMRKVLSTVGAGEVAFSRTEQTVFPVTFTAHLVSSAIKPWEFKVQDLA